MKRRLAALWLALCLGCEIEAPATADLVPTVPEAPPVQASASTSASAPAPCSAPSLAVRGPLDARDSAALSRCQPLPRIAKAEALRCGLGVVDAPVDLARLDQAVRPLDPATAEHVRRIAARGRELGRNPRAFGLVGDSMTVSGAFLRDFAAGYEDRVELAPEVETAVGHVLSFYRGAKAQQLEGVWRDSFHAPRAAKIGARASWALAGGAEAPLRKLIREQSPAVAIVLYGGNDAAWRSGPIEELAGELERHLGAIVDELEQAGIVPVLNTLARHHHMPGMDDCAPGEELSNWRIAVYTNALSARIVELACRRKLPLIDVRHALDAAPNQGLGGDGVHPTAHAYGGGKLTVAGLRCGYNIRNYVTLRMLGQLKELLFEPSTR